MEIGKTMSVCPVCLGKIPAKKVVGEDGNLYMEKHCWDHGSIHARLLETAAETAIRQILSQHFPDLPFQITTEPAALQDRPLYHGKRFISQK